MLERAFITAVLALELRIVVADEPTTNLDTIVERRILELFLDLEKRVSAGFIYITHDISVAATLYDRIAVVLK